jgi:predicted lipoprotein with Yx(FWY)xxD motif
MRKLLAPAVVALILAGCGSDDGGGGAGDAKAPVASADKAKVGRVVVDAQGYTLYRFTAEAQGRPVCTGACAKTWPPATVTKGNGLPDHVATVDRPAARATTAGPRRRTSAATGTRRVARCRAA